MRLLRALISNHPLANIGFVVVLLLGLFSYLTMPREQDPEINFNWVSVTTVLPGASAEEVERLVTNPLEDGIKGVPDVRFVISNSRENVSSMLVRFREIERAHLRQAHCRPAARDPEQGGERAAARGRGSDRSSRSRPATAFRPRRCCCSARPTTKRCASMRGASRTTSNGWAASTRSSRPACAIRKSWSAPMPRRWPRAACSPPTSPTASPPGGAIPAAARCAPQRGSWSISVKGVPTDPAQLADLPVVSATRPGVSARLGEVARIERARAPATQYAASDGRPAISLAVTKKSRTNTLELVDRLKGYVERQNEVLAGSGLRLVLSDDQTVPTREAIGVMQTNALVRHHDGARGVLAVPRLAHRAAGRARHPVLAVRHLRHPQRARAHGQRVGAARRGDRARHAGRRCGGRGRGDLLPHAARPGTRSRPAWMRSSRSGSRCWRRWRRRWRPSCR